MRTASSSLFRKLMGDHSSGCRRGERGREREGSDLAAAPGGGLARSPLQCAASPAFPPSSVKTDSVPRFQTGGARLTVYEVNKAHI